MATATFKIWRTHSTEPMDGTFQTFQTEVSDGMVVLDVVHKIQAEEAPELAKDRVAPEDVLKKILGEFLVEATHSDTLAILRTPPGSARHDDGAR